MRVGNVNGETKKFTSRACRGGGAGARRRWRRPMLPVRSAPGRGDDHGEGGREGAMTNDARATDGDELAARADAFRERLRAEQAATEARGYYSEELHEAFRDAGFYRMFVPRCHGG